MEKSLGITANEAKNGALLAYIAKNIPHTNLRKLLKIVYLIDEKFMEVRGFPFTWFDYYAWAKGPVAPEVYDIKYGAFSKYVTCAKNSDGKWIVDSVLPHKYHVLKQMDVCSQCEMDIINSIVFAYENATADELTELTHRENSLWSQIVRENHIEFKYGKSDIQIPLTMLIAGDEEKEETYEDARWNMGFQAALNRHKNDSNVPTT